MATTTYHAFNEFLTNTINLDSGDSKKAKDSRNWLMSQLESLPSKNPEFPRIYSENNIFYGSFERKTKARPLDDIDIMSCLCADNCTYIEYNGRFEISVPVTARRFVNLCFDNSKILNSNKVVNLFVKELAKIGQYKKAEIKRNGEAVTLELNSYDWNFDIVPCFITTINSNGRNFYVIPDGNGNWKKTDPRIDRERIIKINNYHDKNILQVIRCIKYWNKRPTMPSMSSYLLENMILDYYDNKTEKASKYVDIEIVKILGDLNTRVFSNVSDPKNILSNLNDIPIIDKVKISVRAKSDYEKAKVARQLEIDKNYKDSINKWREIFGYNFPTYK